MTAIKTTDRGTNYFVPDAHGNTVAIRQGPPSFVGGVPTIAIDGLTLTKQAVIDLLPALTAFATTGVVT
jgi:hypothetical protein